MSDPVQINPSVTPAQIRTFVRYALTFMAALTPALVDKYLPEARQTFLLSDVFVEVVSYSIAAGMAGWGAFETWLSKKHLVAAANAAPNSEFVVK